MPLRRVASMAPLALFLAAQLVVPGDLYARAPRTSPLIDRIDRVAAARVLLTASSSASIERRDHDGETSVVLRSGFLPPSSIDSAASHTPVRWVDAHTPIEIEVPEAQGHPSTLRVPGVEVRVFRDRDTTVRLDPRGLGLIAHHDPPGRATGAQIVPRHHDIEEIVATSSREPVHYRFELPAGFALHGPELGVIEVRDAQGRARARVTARDAWDDNGQRLPVSIQREGSTVALSVDAPNGGLIDPTWSSTSTMVLNHVDYRTINLLDGRVLFVGGDTLQSGLCEVFDPTLRTFTVAGTLTEPRSRAKLAMLRDGRVLVAGGRRASDATPATTVEVFDPSKDSSEAFSTLTLSVPFPEGAALTTLLDGTVLIVGGDVDGAPGTQVWQLDPSDGSLSVFATLSFARHDAAVTPLPGGSFLVTGGASVGDAERVFPDGTIQIVGSLHTPRSGHDATLLSTGDVLITGGSSAQSVFPNELWVASVGAFRSLSWVTENNAEMSAVPLANGRVMLHKEGGFEEIRVFDPRSGEAALSTPNSAHNEGRLATLPTGLVLLAGGDTGATVGTSSIAYFPPEEDTTPQQSFNFQDSIAYRVGSNEVLYLSRFAKATLLELPVVDGVTHTVFTSFLGESTPYYSFASTLKLASGRVLSVGGSDISGGSINNNTALYDPSERAWRPGPVAGYIGGASAVRLADDSVLLVGGQMLGGLRLHPLIWHEGDQTFFEMSDASLNFMRHRATTTLLPTGEVLVAGGMSNGGGAVLPFEVFDPTTHQFTAVNGDVLGRVGHSATVLPNGDVLVLGGVTDDTFSPTGFTPPSVRYVTATHTLAPVSFPARGHHVAVRLQNGKVLVAGGTDYTNDEQSVSLSDAYLYDPNDDSFTPTGSLIAPSPRPAAVLLDDGRVLIADTRLQVYDPATGVFTELGTPSATLYDGSSLSLLPNGDVLATGGLDGSGQPRSAFARLDPETLVFRSIAPAFAIARTGHRATLLDDGRTTFTGGRNANGDPLASYATLSRDGTTLSDGGELKTARSSHAAARRSDGKIVLAGGAASGQVEIVDVTTSTSSLAPTTVAIRDRVASARTNDGDLIVAGGRNESVSALAVERLDHHSAASSSLGSLQLGKRSLGGRLPGGGVLFAGAGTIATFATASPGSSAQIIDTTLSTPVAMTTLLSGDTLIVHSDDTHTYSRLVSPGGQVIDWDEWKLATKTSGESGALLQLPDGQIVASLPGSGPDGPIQIVRRRTNVKTTERPGLSGVPTTIQPGVALTLAGSRLRRYNATNTKYLDPVASIVPNVFFMPEGGGGPVLATVKQATDTQIEFVLPASPYHGPGWLYVSTNGVASIGQLTTLVASTPGSACTLDTECESTHCVEGVCCESACQSACFSCLASRQSTGGTNGLCLATAQGTDPRDSCEQDTIECGRTGLCDGSGACALVALGTPCNDQTGTCNAGTCIAPLPATCDPDGKTVVQSDGTRLACDPFVCRDGACVDQCTSDAECVDDRWCTNGDCRGCSTNGDAVLAGTAEIPCAPFACDRGVCNQTCLDDQGCASGYRCNAGVCGPYCDSTETQLISPDRSVDCSPYRCLDARCASECETNLSCAPGMQCGLDHTCRAPKSPAAAESGCSVSRSGNDTSDTPTWIVTLLSIAAVARSRRRRSLPRVRSRLTRAAMLGSIVLSMLLSMVPREARADGPDARDVAAAKEEFRRGIVLFEAGDIEMALEYFRRSRALFPSKQNTLNMAVCLDRMGRHDEALEMFEETLAKFASDLSEKDRAEMPANVAQLRGKVGEIEIVGASSGQVFVDGRLRAKLPLTLPIRSLPGKRKIRVVDEGYAPFTAEISVAQGERIRVEAHLEALTSAGVLRVEEDSLEGADLFIDGAVAGKLPWSGLLAPGVHLVQAIRDDKGSSLQSITILQGQTALVRLSARPLARAVRVEAIPASATLQIDGLTVGHGTWEGRLPEGAHRVEAREDGYKLASKVLVLPRGDDELISLKLEVDTSHPRWPKPPETHIWFGLTLGAGVTSSMKSGAEDACGSLCTRTPALGPIAMITAALDLPKGPTIELSGGYVALATSVKRHVLRDFGGTPPLNVDFALSSTPVVRGPFVGAGASYKLPLTREWALRTGITLGVLFATSSDDVHIQASTSTSSTTALVDGATASSKSTPLIVMPRIAIERNFGAIDLSAALMPMFVTTSGTSTPRGTVTVPPSCSPADPRSVGCTPEVDLVRGQRGHGPFDVIFPTLGIRYTPR